MKNLTDKVCVFHVNIQGLSNKIDELSLFLDKFNFDVVCLSEHWYCKSDLKLVKFNNYKLCTFFCRSEIDRGGVSIYTRHELLSVPLNLDKYSTELDAEFCGLELCNLKIAIITLYRSGATGDSKIFLNKLEQLLVDVSSKFTKIILLGDFNIDFMGQSSILKEITCLISTFNLNITILEYTRVTEHSSTCIDNILTNISVNNCYMTGVIDPCLSDHFGQYIILNSKVPVTVTDEVPIRNITIQGIKEMRTLLSLENWTTFSNSNMNITVFVTFIIQTYQFLVHKCFPLKTKSLFNKPPICWFNNNLRTMRDTLSAVKTVVNISQNPNDMLTYKLLRGDYKKAIKDTKKNTYSSYIQQSTNKPKDCWKLINYERNYSITSKFSSTDISASDFNVFFSSVADNIIKTLETNDNKPSDFLKNISCKASFFLDPVTPSEVYNAIMSLKNSASFDIYDINTKIIKETVDFLVMPLTSLANECFSTGYFPDEFKLSKIVPIFKKGNSDDIDNYRPISIVPFFGKILEILIKTRLEKYFENNFILNDSQYGFRKNRSTIKAVLRVVEDVVEGLERGTYTAVTLCDLSKAFDCISHETLLEKLSVYGVRGTPLLLIKSYLTNRSQCVTFNNNISDFKSISRGVPQGSVLGPLLFVIYINDLCYHMLPDGCILFADDTTLSCSGINKENTLQLAKNNVLKAESWFTINNLKLNKDKTQSVIFSSGVPHDNESVKLLGITLDSSLKWTNHIDDLCKKLSSQVYLMRQLRKLFDNDTLLNAYYGVVHSSLIYGVILWGNSSTAIRVFRLQKKVIRIIAKVGPTEHCKPLFKKFKIMPLPSIYIFYSLLEIHSNYCRYNTNSSFHNYPTRSANLIRIPRFRLQRSSHNSLDVNLYNKLPQQIKKLNNLQFKNIIKRIMRDNCFYSIQEYMDTPSSLLECVYV